MKICSDAICIPCGRFPPDYVDDGCRGNTQDLSGKIHSRLDQDGVRTQTAYGTEGIRMVMDVLWKAREEQDRLEGKDPLWKRIFPAYISDDKQ